MSQGVGSRRSKIHSISWSAAPQQVISQPREHHVLFFVRTDVGDVVGTDAPRGVHARAADDLLPELAAIRDEQDSVLVTYASVEALPPQPRGAYGVLCAAVAFRQKAEIRYTTVARYVRQVVCWYR